jgi:hypothetical protein
MTLEREINQQTQIVAIPKTMEMHIWLNLAPKESRQDSQKVWNSKFSWMAF